MTTAAAKAKAAKAAKVDLGNEDIRQAFYQTSDGTYGLEQAAKDNAGDDAALAAKIKALHAALSAVHSHLEAGYLWD